MLISRPGLDAFFTDAGEILCRYQQDGEGKVMVDCKRLNAPETKSSTCKVLFYGSPVSPYYISWLQLEEYLAQTDLNQRLGDLTNPIDFFKGGVMQVMTTTGHGNISLEFERQRRGKAFVVGRVTRSYRWTLPSSPSLL